MIVVVMGVAGSGKTTIGAKLADALKSTFVDGDSLHPDTNVEAIRSGQPLSDADREPWLMAIHARLLDAFHRGNRLVVACSALKRSYREVLGSGIPVSWVYLKGDPGLIHARLARRSNHFMKPDLLPSQFDVLEEPAHAVVVDVSPPPEVIVAAILDELRRKPDIRVLPDLNALSLRAAEAVVDIVNDTVSRSGGCSLVLSGGSTPVMFHRMLASTFHDRIPWSQIHVFWGDDRYVPHDHVQSNYRMARETLLDHVPCPPTNIHPMPTEFANPDDAARDYGATLERYWEHEDPHLDLAIMGMGPEGHTASLFPGAPALRERTRMVVAATVPADPPQRLTLTLPAFARCTHAHFLVTGADKARVLGHVLSGKADVDEYPAAGVRPAQGPVVWWLDREAALGLGP